MEAYLTVTKQEATSYAGLKGSLGLSKDDEILNYIKAKTVNGYNQKNLILRFDSNIAKKKG